VDEPGAGAPPKVVKRSIVIAGHRTSVSMEEAFWAALSASPRRTGIFWRPLVAQVDAARARRILSSALRVLRWKGFPGRKHQRSAAATANI